MNKDENTEKRVSDVMTDQPIVFTVRYKETRDTVEFEHKRFLLLFKRKVGRHVEKDVEVERRFVIEPPRLGKMQILSRYFLELDLDEKALDENPVTEAIRVSENKTDLVCEMMAAAVCNTREELMDEGRRRLLADFFKWNARTEDLSVLMVSLLIQQDYTNFITSTRLTKTFRLNKPTGTQEADRVE